MGKGKEQRNSRRGFRKLFIMPDQRHRHNVLQPKRGTCNFFIWSSKINIISIMVYFFVIFLKCSQEMLLSFLLLKCFSRVFPPPALKNISP